MTQKLLDQLERDLRNQVLIDQMKRLNRKGKLMVYINRHKWNAIVMFSAAAWVILYCLMRSAFAAECPTVGESCKIIMLSPTEEKILMQQNGVLDTAAQGRALDLGQFIIYLKTRINSAPQGDMKPAENKAAAPVDNK